MDWFYYDVGGALLPFAASVSVHFFAGRSVLEAIIESPEILFFAIIASMTASRDATKMIADVGFGLTFRILDGVLKFIPFWATFFYGYLLRESIANPSASNFPAKLFPFSLTLATAAFLASAGVQILIGRIEDRSPP